MVSFFFDVTNRLFEDYNVIYLYGPCKNGPSFSEKYFIASWSHNVHTDTVSQSVQFCQIRRSRRRPRTSLETDRTLKSPLSLWGRLKTLFIFPKTKNILRNLYKNTFLRMSKLRAWSTLIFAMPFLIMLCSILRSLKYSRICNLPKKPPVLEQLKNQIQINSK